MDAAKQRKADISRGVFVTMVWPLIAPHVGGGELQLVEDNASDSMRRQLDMYAGIDSWQVISDGSRMRGIASRVQPGTWMTFTIRCRRHTGHDTEWQKRCAAIDAPEDGWLLPHLTVQAYTTNDHQRLLGVGVARTTDLFAYARKYVTDDLRVIDRRRAGIRRSTEPGGWSDFVYLRWDLMVLDGVQLILPMATTTTPIPDEARYRTADRQLSRDIEPRWTATTTPSQGSLW